MLRFMYCAFVGAFVLVLVPGVHGQATSQPTDNQQQATTAPDTVVAEVRGQKLTFGQVQAFKKNITPRQATQQIIDSWKVSTIIADEVSKSKLFDDPAVKQAVKIAETNLLARILLRVKTLRTTLSDEEVRQYYEERSKGREFREPAIVTIKVIATKDKEDITKLNDLLIAGEDFDKIMNENAEQTKKTTRLSSVVVEKVSTKSLIPNLGSQVYALATAKLDRPIGPRKIRSGWVIFKVVEREEGKLKPLEAVRETISQKLLRKKQRKVGNDLRRMAEEEAGIKRQSRRSGPRKPTAARVPQKPANKPAGK